MFDVDEIQETLGLVFQQDRLLYEALTHRSFTQRQGSKSMPHNERLEFLGDAVLGLVMSECVTEMFPAFSEGALSKAKASLISRQTLAKVAERLGFGQWLRLGRGEEINSGREKHSLLANALEALIGAVYLDKGLESARQFIHRVLMEELSDLRDTPGLVIGRDWKSQLQEWVHKYQGTSPRYRLIRESGPDHQKLFAVAVEVSGKVMGRGEGHTKKEAEQRAAEEALAFVTGQVATNN